MLTIQTENNGKGNKGPLVVTLHL